MSSEENLFIYNNQLFNLNDDWLDIYSHCILLGPENKVPPKEWFVELEDMITRVDLPMYMETSRRWVSAWLPEVKRYLSWEQEILGDPARAIEKRASERTPDWILKIYGPEYASKPIDSEFVKNARFYLYRNIAGKVARGFIHSTRFTKDLELAALAQKCIMNGPNEQGI